MKIKELIQKLSEFDENLEVLVDGYEEGFDNIDSIKIIKVIHDNPFMKDEWGELCKETNYEGEYSLYEPEDKWKDFTGYEVLEILNISRK